MAIDPKRRTLGRGLAALMGDDSEDYAQLDRLRTSRAIAIDQLRPSAIQPRRQMQPDELQELAASIAERGVLQPILVRRVPDEPHAFEIIAGERRWRAAQLAQLHEVPAIVKDLDDGEALQVALIENLQRQDLNPLEEAEGYRRLMQEFGHSQENLAGRIGKSRSHVANTLRLLTLPEEVKALVDAGELTAGHARALIGSEAAGELAREVAARKLSVRDTEALAAQRREAPARPAASSAKDPDTLALERDLSALLAAKVEIRGRGKAGKLIVHYRSLEQLEALLEGLGYGDRGRPPAP
jgi:ParB family chromosome partitioning protein